jgi:hypothetical protein
MHLPECVVIGRYAPPSNDRSTSSADNWMQTRQLIKWLSVIAHVLISRWSHLHVWWVQERHEQPPSKRAKQQESEEGVREQECTREQVLGVHHACHSTLHICLETLGATEKAQIAIACRPLFRYEETSNLPCNQQESCQTPLIYDCVVSCYPLLFSRSCRRRRKY